MSVEVKTPTRTPFQCGERGVGSALLENITSNVTSVSVGGIVLHSQGCGTSSTNEGSHGQVAAKVFHRKRKLSDRGGNFHQMGSRKKPYRKGEKMVRPSKFLLGGNITDPLNLNALYDDDVGKALNQITPQSSPMPVPPYKQEVQLLIPPNINDPLNLNAGEEASLISPKFGSKKKKHKHKKKRLSVGIIENVKTEFLDAEPPTGHDRSPPLESGRPESLDLTNVKELTGTNTGQKDCTMSEKFSKIIDKIVSPVIPQQPPKAKKLKRLSSESLKIDDEESTSKELEKAGSRKSTPQKPKAKRQTSTQSIPDGKSAKNRERYMYGNYNRYYGYRNPGEQEDHRLSCFRADWFAGKDVLDIGCNIGHITLSVAKTYNPQKIIGMDIDSKLVSIAKKNIRHYMTKEAIDTRKFPSSLHLTYGPIAPPPVPTNKDASGFPFNVMFVHGNYVLKTEEELEMVQEEYDTILGLSITKWVHLNWGDAGIKRMFKRIFRHLRPGGKFVLEPQPWSSYKKKKKTTDAIFKTFQEITFRPEQFTEYLLSKEVGFVACEHLDVPFNQSQGFQRPLHIYIKSESGTTPIEGVTPLMQVDCTPGTTPHAYTPYKETSRGATPRSSGLTPCSSCHNTPTYLHGAWSAGGTPRYDSDTGESGTPRTVDTADRTPVKSSGDLSDSQSRTTDNG